MNPALAVTLALVAIPGFLILTLARVEGSPVGNAARFACALLLFPSSS